MTDVLRDEFFVYFPELKTLLNKLKKFRVDGLYPIVEEMGEDECIEIRAASRDPVSKRDKRFAFLKNHRSTATDSIVYKLQIWGPKIRQYDKEIQMQIEDTPADFGTKNMAGSHIVVSLTPVRDVGGYIIDHTVTLKQRQTLNEARKAATEVPDALNYICTVSSVVDNRVDQRMEMVQKIIEQANALAKAMAHARHAPTSIPSGLTLLNKISEDIESLTHYFRK